MAFDDSAVNYGSKSLTMWEWQPDGIERRLVWGHRGKWYFHLCSAVMTFPMVCCGFILGPTIHVDVSLAQSTSLWSWENPVSFLPFSRGSRALPSPFSLLYPAFLYFICCVCVCRSVESHSLWPMDCNPLPMGFSRQEYWISLPCHWTQVSCIADRLLTIWATREPDTLWVPIKYPMKRGLCGQ